MSKETVSQFRERKLREHIDNCTQTDCHLKELVNIMIMEVMNK